MMNHDYMYTCIIDENNFEEIMKGKNNREWYDLSYLLEIDISEILHKHTKNSIQHIMSTQNFTLETLNRENR